MAVKNNLVFKLHPSVLVVLIAEFECTFLLSLKKKKNCYSHKYMVYLREIISINHPQRKRY